MYFENGIQLKYIHSEDILLLSIIACYYIYIFYGNTSILRKSKKIVYVIYSDIHD